jgi:predicted nucleic acid-binding protein
VVDLDGQLALSAARLSARLLLPMADSVMPATARAYRTALWTQDDDFLGVPGVQHTRREGAQGRTTVRRRTRMVT